MESKLLVIARSEAEPALSLLKGSNLQLATEEIVSLPTVATQELVGDQTSEVSETSEVCPPVSDSYGWCDAPWKARNDTTGSEGNA